MQGMQDAAIIFRMTLKSMWRCIFLVCLCGLAVAADAQPKDRSGGFQNNYMDFAPRGLADFLRWRWNAVREGLPPAPALPTPSVQPDLDFIHTNARAGTAMQPAVTWIGHATVLAQIGGLSVLTDPIFSERAAPVSFAGPKRAHAPGVALAELPHIDLVVVSHNHYDHCDAPSLQALNARPAERRCTWCRWV